MYAAAYRLEDLGYELETGQEEFEDFFTVDVAQEMLASEHVVLWSAHHARTP